ncbi:MAG: DNA polymerase III subunit beta [Porphyromonas sp.]|nr:DNA polymerase III subunit beta [Porphyromonas sp.]
MKFQTSSTELYLHLQVVAKVIDSKSTNVLPVLDNILFEVEDGKLTLSAADMNNRLTTQMEIQTLGPTGSFMIQHRTLLDLLKDLPEQPVTIHVDTEANYKLKIEYSNGFFDFTAAEASSYPEDIQISEELTSVELDAASLLAGINATKFAAATDERRPIMTGVLMDFLEDKLVYVASDGRYLVRYTDNNVQSGHVAQICVPATICNLLTGSLLPKENGNIRLSYTAQHLRVELSQFTLTARLLDGKFPNYNSVIPQTSPFEVTVSREALLYGSKRVANCANRASKMVLLLIKDNEITLQSKDLDLSISGEEKLRCSVNVAEHNIRIGFDSELLGRILGSMSASEVTLSLADQTRAAIIRPIEEAKGIETLCLLIPLKLLSDR